MMMMMMKWMKWEYCNLTIAIFFSLQVIDACPLVFDGPLLSSFAAVLSVLEKF